MFWSDTGDGHGGFIKRSWLDGSHIKDIKTGSSLHPLALALDTQHHRLYYSDNSRHIIAYIDLNGNNEVVLINDYSARYVQSLQVFKVICTWDRMDVHI